MTTVGILLVLLTSSSSPKKLALAYFSATTVNSSPALISARAVAARVASAISIKRIFFGR